MPVQVTSQGRTPLFRYALTGMALAGVDGNTSAPGQDPEMWELLTNIQPVTRGVLERRWGYSLWANPGSTSTQIIDYQSDITGARQVLASSTASVKAYNDDGSSYNASVLTPSMGAGAPRGATSRSYAYLTNGTDYKKWNGASSGGVSAWGIDVNNVTTSGAIVGPNFPSTVTDEGLSGGSASQGPIIAGTGASVLNTFDGATFSSGWSNPSDVTTTGVYAQSLLDVTHSDAGISAELQGTNFGFSIPGSATIIGIQVDTAWFVTAPPGDGALNEHFSLLRAGSHDGEDKGGSILPGAATGISFGNSGDLWTSSWTPADINDPGFGATMVVLNYTGVNPVTANVGTIQITVWYTTPSTTSWATPNNVKVDDAAVSSATASVSGTSILQTTNYGFGAVTGPITGIKVEIKCNASATCTITPRLQKTSIDYGATKNGTPSLGALGYLVFGGQNDLWGGTWIASEITPSSFGVAWNAYTGAGTCTINVDAVRITVYTAPGPITIGATAAGNITLNVGRVYTYCFKNSSTGHYSDIGVFTASTGPLASKVQAVASLPTHNDSQVDKIVILATADGGDESRLYFLVELANGSGAYNDNTPEATLLTNPVLLSTDGNGDEFGVTANDPPPVGPKFPTKHRGRFYMLKGPTLYWSKSITEVTTDTGFIAGRWEECWPAENQTDISEGAETGAGLLSDGINLYIGTEFKIRRVNGDIISSGLEPPDVVHNETGILNQDVLKIVFAQGTPNGGMWLTPDNRIILSDFNTYNDVGTPIQGVLNTINTTVAKATACASFYSNGALDLYILAIPTGTSTTNNTQCVFNLRTQRWVVWNLTDTVSAFMFNIQASGAPQLWIGANTGKLYTLTPNSAFDRINDTPVTFPVTARTSWLALGDASKRKLLNEIEVITEDPTLTITTEGATTTAQFANPDTVESTNTVVLSILGAYKVFLAGLPAKDRYYRFTFSSSNANIRTVLGGYVVRALVR